METAPVSVTQGKDTGIKKKKKEKNYDKKTEKEIEKQQEEIIDLEKVDEKIMTIHDFLDDFTV